jgi:hypothetical protein
MRVSRGELPVVAKTGDYTGAWAELGDMHYAFGHRPYMLAETELLQLTRKSEHNELVREFAAAGLFPSE